MFIYHLYIYCFSTNKLTHVYTNLFQKRSPKILNKLVILVHPLCSLKREKRTLCGGWLWSLFVVVLFLVVVVVVVVAVIFW